MHEGDEITTIEGPGATRRAHPMQAAFVDLRRISMRVLARTGQIIRLVAACETSHLLGRIATRTVKDADARQYRRLAGLYPKHRRCRFSKVRHNA